MKKENKIEKEINELGWGEVLRKYNKPQDLLTLLSVFIKQENYNLFAEVLDKLPKTAEFDNIKCDVISKFKEEITYSICRILESVFSDDLKLKLIEECADYLYDYEIASIISSLNELNLKREKFREYIDYFDADEFSNYLRRIKDDDIRESEFLLFKDKFPDYRLDWYASSFDTKEKRIEVFKKNFDESKKDEIPFFISRFKDESTKIDLLNYYINSIDKKDISLITSHIEDQEKIIDIIRKYKENIPGYELRKMLMKINDERRYQLLDEVSKYMDNKNIMNMIIEIDNYDKKVEVFDKYVQIFDYDDLRTMLIHVEDEKQAEFLDKHIELYRNILANIWLEIEEYSRFEGLNADRLLEKYIDYLDRSSISAIMARLIDKYGDASSVLMYLLLKTSNPNTIQNIHTAAKLACAVNDVESKEKRR